MKEHLTLGSSALHLIRKASVTSNSDFYKIYSIKYFLSSVSQNMTYNKKNCVKVRTYHVESNSIFSYQVKISK